MSHHKDSQEGQTMKTIKSLASRLLQFTVMILIAFVVGACLSALIIGCAGEDMGANRGLDPECDSEARDFVLIDAGAQDAGSEDCVRRREFCDLSTSTLICETTCILEPIEAPTVKP